MIDLVKTHLSQVRRLCRRFGVCKLELFGSASRGDFNDHESDIDFVIEFLDKGPGLAKRFFGFSQAMEALFGRQVDFVFGPDFKNPYFREAVNESREPIYEAGDSEVAA